MLNIKPVKKNGAERKKCMTHKMIIAITAIFAIAGVAITAFATIRND